MAFENVLKGKMGNKNPAFISHASKYFVGEKFT
jgi:hypothetical protein